METTLAKAKAVPRGIRNNNPLNIRINPANRWQGRVPLAENTDGTFEQFRTAMDGLRAAAVLMIAHYDRRGADTIHKLVSIWAPPNENDTVDYIETVEEATGLDRDAPIDLHDHGTIKPIMRAMIGVENGGQQPYTDAQLDEALRRAGVVPPPAPVAKTAAADAAKTLIGGGGLALGSIATYAQQANDTGSAVAGLVATLRALGPIAGWAALAVGVGVLAWIVVREIRKRRLGTA